MSHAPKEELKPAAVGSFKEKVYTVIFEADTPGGKAFDVVLLAAIALSISAVMLESVASFEKQYGNLLDVTEWILTVLFTLEYVLRLWCVRKPWQYARSFYGVVDILAILPAYLSLLLSGSHYFAIIRALRLLRVFRVLKLGHYLGEAKTLATALKASVPKITVFLGAVLIGAVFIGALMYLVEGPEHGFTSIPKGVYWAIVTLTTVGYGDIAPQTVLGQSLASLVMIAGYGVLAVPTGIVSVELFRGDGNDTVTTQVCPTCTKEGHDDDAEFCKYCGGNLDY